MTRVIAGVLKGRKLSTPPGRGLELRPTADRVKTVLFDVLGPLTGEARVLDLFAGTGALGIEALSRGANEATFVDLSSLAVRLVRANIAALDLGARAHVVRADAFSFAERALAAGQSWTLVLADPPYEEPRAAALLERCSGLVAPGGRLALEHTVRDALPEAAGELALERHRPVGGTALTIYRRANAAPDRGEV